MDKIDAFIFGFYATLGAFCLALVFALFVQLAGGLNDLDRIETVDITAEQKLLRDEETGVLYLVDNSTGITPLYNADGTLCVE